MKLYKFRPLGSCLDLERAGDSCPGQILCSPFWELNDPMEGVYRYSEYALGLESWAVRGEEQARDLLVLRGVRL